ncbi:RIP metalloprotease RseP [Larsenimonas suaedae]|uniref:Zinc metalloprotease n=1 Tax=Larsenimonas suaedae TaxID=1851019 RepID=A0ABU1GS91_9GAMM|nr:RIP metalloprotease RseP [Larsenimonas suaedae]MCM2972315.1 RIP metalloprotease RseP [Larsenimonas suaedae]MDR5894889.1 RIP metalloprotease RseP [Larsenimonas suaedae]
MGVLENVLAVIVVLGLLITIHEYGHFWAARRCGVRVLRFSVGFGKPLLMRRDRHGTEYVLAAIPLGGYVRMLDERESDVPASEQAHAFNRQSVYKRMFIAAAGPLANFLLAFIAYWVLFVSGTTVIAPVIGGVAPDSPAARAGLGAGQEITQVAGRDTPSWSAVNLQLLSEIGHTGELEVQTRPFESDARSTTHALPVTRFLAEQKTPDPLSSMGITPWQPPVPALIGKVLDDSPAARAGLKAGDRIERVDGRTVESWQSLVGTIQASAGTPMALTVARDGQEQTLTLTPETKSLERGREVGYIGAAAAPFSWPESHQRQISYSPLAAIGQAVHKTGEMTQLTLASIGKMIVGLISPSNLSGPITIARVAGDSARSGLETFIGFLAYLSISLGVLNLLPVPVLDGGHLLFYLAEAIRGKPLPERVQTFGLKVGFALIGVLMVMAFYFDLMRL